MTKELIRTRNISKFNSSIHDALQYDICYITNVKVNKETDDYIFKINNQNNRNEKNRCLFECIRKTVPNNCDFKIIVKTLWSTY